jgi:hypothetical protein
MRYLLLAILLAIPVTASATPCGTPGTNVPLTANTRSGQQAQDPGQAAVTPGLPSSGSLKADRQAYPH